MTSALSPLCRLLATSAPKEPTYDIRQQLLIAGNNHRTLKSMFAVIYNYTNLFVSQTDHTCKSSLDITSLDAYHKVTTSLLYVFVGIDFARARPVNQTDSHTHRTDNKQEIGDLKPPPKTMLPPGQYNKSNIRVPWASPQPRKNFDANICPKNGQQFAVSCFICYRTTVIDLPC